MKIFKRFLHAFLTFLFITITIQTFNGCTTAMYGQTLVPDQTISDQYTLKVYVGAVAGSETAKKRAVVEINKYMKEYGYTSYEILSQEYNFFPQYYSFVVKLTK